jgi:hypothetical protein
MALRVPRSPTRSSGELHVSQDSVPLNEQAAADEMTQ